MGNRAVPLGIGPSGMAKNVKWEQIHEGDTGGGTGSGRDGASRTRAGHGGGRAIVQKCLACHRIGEGARRSARSSTASTAASPATPDYNYSDANKIRTTWNEATFKDYIRIRAKIPGTKMIFPGIKNEKEAGNLWAYLQVVRRRR